MRDIFRRAIGVIGWLGKTQHSLLALWAIVGLFGKRQIAQAAQASDEDSFRKEYFFNEDAEWKPLRNLFKQPWLTRVWVVQEVAAAQNVRLVYGNLIISWDALEELTAL